jgi:hypothetical protein
MQDIFIVTFPSCIVINGRESGDCHRLSHSNSSSSITRSGHPNLCDRWDPRATKHFLRATSYRQANNPSVSRFLLLSYASLQYCLLVLFHEATVQLLLWRSGERRSPDLLSPGDEERLRLIGLAKSEERAWVDEILRMRRMKTRKDDSRPLADAALDEPSSQRTLRPRIPPLVR